MINMTLLERAHCTREEKKMVASTIVKLVYLSEKAHSEGVLALESELATFDNQFMKMLFQMSVEGVDVKEIQTTGEITMIMSEMAGQELLNSLIILEGAIGIQNGTHPGYLIKKFIIYLGRDTDLMDEFFAEYEKSRNT